MVWNRTDFVIPNRFLTAYLYLDTVLKPNLHPLAAAVGQNFHLFHDNVYPNTTRIFFFVCNLQ